MSDRKRPRPFPRHARPSVRPVWRGAGPVLAKRDIDDVRSACARKNAYPSMIVAEAVAARCEAERGVPLFAYPCDACGRWHLTSKRRRAA